MTKCYAPNMGGSWMCHYLGIQYQGNPCCAPVSHKCDFKKKPKKQASLGVVGVGGGETK